MATDGDRQLRQGHALAARPVCTPGSPRCTTAGCSAAIFPEFDAIHCRVIRDFYHKYTVDEHTLLTIRDLERLVESADAGQRAFSSHSRRSCTSPSC